MVHNITWKHWPVADYDAFEVACKKQNKTLETFGLPASQHYSNPSQMQQFFRCYTFHLASKNPLLHLEYPASLMYRHIYSHIRRIHYSNPSLLCMTFFFFHLEESCRRWFKTFPLGHLLYVWLCVGWKCVCVYVSACLSSTVTCVSPSSTPGPSWPLRSHPLERHDRAPVFGNGCAGSDKQFKEESALM